MPAWRKLVQSGSSALLNSLYVSNGVTGSLVGTASTASFVTSSNVWGPYGRNSILSASWAPGSTSTTIINGNPGGGSYTGLTTLYVSGSGVTLTNPSAGIVSMSVSSGGGAATTPGGVINSIQYNNGLGGFGGDSIFVYDTSNQRISFDAASDLTAAAINNPKSSIKLQNSNYTPKGTTFSQNIFSWTADVISANTTSLILSFFAHSANMERLEVLSFKCDYSLAIWNGSLWSGGKIGTLMGTWDYDESKTPVLVDSSISGDATYEFLDDVTFNLSWNASSEIELYIDNSLNNQDIAFTGIFTVFNIKY